jgi:hypothetical protein
MATQSFHLGDILSITTGRLVSPAGVDGIYNILSFLTGDDLSFIQLPLASDAVKDSIFEQYPWLHEIVIEDNYEFDGKESVFSWLDLQIEKYGEFHSLTSVPNLWSTL